MNNIIVIAGVPGAGKTSLLNEVDKRTGDTFNKASFGSEMLKICQEKGLVQERDEMRNLPITTQKKIQISTAEKIRQMNGNILLDTHLAIKSDVGYIPGFTKEILDILKPKAIILVDANEVEIRGRRKMDKSRPHRTIESFEDILEHKLINWSFASIAANQTDSLLKIVQNHTGEFEEAIETVIKTLDFILNK